MQRWLIGVVITVLISAGTAMGSTSRLRTLGNETRLLIDDSNVFVYPSTIVDYSEVIAEPFDNWAGALYGVKGKQSFGIMFDRPYSTVRRLNRTLNGLGGVFTDLDVKPWVDLFYGVRVGETGAFGAGFSVAYDRNGSDNNTVSAKDVDVALGATLKQKVYLTANLNIQRFSEEAAAVSYTGTSFGLEGRGMFSSGISRIIPLVSLSAGTHDVDDASFFNATGGIGISVRPVESTEAVVGVLVDGRSETRTIGGTKLTDRMITLPRLIGAAETKVGSVSVRVGFERDAVLTTNQEVKNGGAGVEPFKVDVKGFDTTFRIDFGLGFKLGSVDLDGVVEKDLFRNGPNFIGGKGQGFFSNATLTYRL